MAARAVEFVEMKQLRELFMLVIITTLGTQMAIADSSPTVQPRFPEIRTSDLNGRSLTLPSDFEANYNLCLIAFERNQQKNVETWVNGAQPIVEHAGISIYVIPVIQRVPGFVREFISSGMRRGTPNPQDRNHTITLFIDKGPFCRSLNLPSERTIYAVLVDKSGNVVWQASGDFTPAAGQGLSAAISNTTSGH